MTLARPILFASHRWGVVSRPRPNPGGARPILFTAVLLAAGWPSVAGAQPKDAKEPAAPKEVSYYRDIRPIFQQHCQGCHQPAKPQGGFIMTSHAALLKKGDSDQPGVVPGKPDESMIVFQITSHDGQPPAMPRGRDPLTAAQVNLIKTWIAQGAKDDTPASARVVVDMNHPPVYELPPVITALAYSPLPSPSGGEESKGEGGGLLAVGGYHEVLLYRADGSELVARLVGEAERIQSVAFSPDGKLLAVAGGSPGRFGEVQVWDVAARKLKLSVPVTYDTVYGVSWSPDGSKIAFGCADNSLRAIDAENGKQVLFQGAHNDWVLDTVFSADGSHLVSVSRDRSMKLTEVATQRFIDNITSITPGALKGGLLTVSRRPQKEQKMAKVPPDTPGAAPKIYDELLVGGSDGVPRLYKMHREVKRVIGDDANKLREYEPMPGRVYTGCFSPDGSLMAVGSSLEGRGEVRVYQVDDGKRIATLEGQKGPVYVVRFAPDGKTVASAGFDGMVRLNDAQTGKLIKEFVPVPLRPNP
ncbi:MAG TPA: c-type cytochrome domain-containing protein [Gemmataceae bacterium]|nr:c-type cytochrome domain-containing protein [Gemmataceae bacterium]